MSDTESHQLIVSCQWLVVNDRADENDRLKTNSTLPYPAIPARSIRSPALLVSLIFVFLCL